MIRVDSETWVSSHREIDLERRVERPPVSGGLDQCRAERVLESFTVLERNMPDGFSCVDALCQGDRQPGCPELGNEAFQDVEQRRLRCSAAVAVARSSSLAHPIKVGLVLEQDIQRLVRHVGVDRLYSEYDESPGPVESL